MIVKSRLAVVTGGSGGIGGAVCRKLSMDGYVILAQYRHGIDGARALTADIGAQGGECHTVCADLVTDTGVEEVCEAVDTLLSSNPALEMRVLVNNAAKLLGPSFLDAKPSQFDDYFAVNVKAPFFLSQQLLQKMRAGGSIINISSAGAHFSSPGDIVYAMTKASLESLTRNMAECAADRDVRVNTVVPGFTDNGHEAFKIRQVQEYMSSFAVLGGVSDPETVAEAVSFLTSDRAKRTTGAVLDVSGGSTLGARGARASSVSALIDHD